MAMSILDTRAPNDADIAIALVPDAWTRACRAAGRVATEPRGITALKPQKRGRKSGTYRLEGVDAPVVAKRSSRANAMLERQIYERVLPTTGLPALTLYGCVEDDTDPAYCWLFVEYAGPATLMQRDASLVAQWLGRLHVSCAALADTICLPERGPPHYLEHLRAAQRNIDCGTETADLTVSERATLAQLRQMLDAIEAQWEALCAPCAALPRTLVHGDLARKNCRLRGTPDAPSVVMFDWETAGWGPPAADLAQRDRPPHKTPDGWGGTVALDAYATVVVRAWPAVTRRTIEQQSRVGTVFRLIAATRWASELFPVGGGSRGVAKLSWIPDRLAAALAAAAGCDA